RILFEWGKSIAFRVLPKENIQGHGTVFGAHLTRIGMPAVFDGPTKNKRGRIRFLSVIIDPGVPDDWTFDMPRAGIILGGRAIELGSVYRTEVGSVIFFFWLCHQSITILRLRIRG